MKLALLLALMLAGSAAFAATVKVDVNIMPRVLFTGDSQTCGRVGAWDFPQMLSWEMPLRIINTSVGGTGTTHLLNEITGGTAEVTAGEQEVKGAEVGWHAGPYPGQTIRLGEQEYTIDRIETVSYAECLATIWLTEPAREDFSGDDYAIEPGWRVRVVARHPDYACFVFTVNDAGSTSEVFSERIEEFLRRCGEIGARPILLSGFPLMDDERGGSHPGHNPIAVQRPADLAAIATEHQVPYGDVFRTLMSLDEQSTAVWRDTVHPTTDGSMAAMNAMRYIFGELGLASNPYYLHAVHPNYSGTSAPISTSQPDYSAAGALDENQFSLEAIHLRDEYGLLAEADGEGVEAEPGLFLHFGVGPLEPIERITIETVVTGANRLKYYDWTGNQWLGIAEGAGNLTGVLEGETLAKAWHDGEVRIWLAGAERVSVDYASATIEGDVAPWEPERRAGPIVWPTEGDLVWQGGGLIVNGGLTEGDGAAPTGWEKRGEGAAWVRDEIVAAGTGSFARDRSIDLFRSEDADFAATVRALDMLTIADGPEGCTGGFLVSRVEEDGALRLRRRASEEAADLSFEVRRWSGCGATPGGCAVQASGGSYWQTLVQADAGRYRLGFFYRAYDPAAMKARGTPGKAAEVRVLLGPANQLASSGALECSYQWQRGWLEFVLPGEGELHIQARARSATPVEFTGFSLAQM